ncbi:MAG: PH domain-containing protein, partial [Ferruginibacter sp.]
MLKTEEINEQYSLPQRQAPVGVIIEIIYAFQKFIRRFWPLLIVIVVRLKTFGLLYSSLIIILILIAIVVFGYLNYKNFLFHINEKDEEFILEKGIFDKKRIAIKLSRIQQVNINQSFFQKFIDVYEVEIETAGSTKKEVKINAVSKENAFKMRNILLTETQYKKEKDEVVIKKEITESNLIKISPNSLLKVAVTSDYFKSLWLVAIFLFASYNRLKEIFFNDKESESKVFDYFSKLNIEHYVIIIIASIIILVFIFNLLKTFIIYYDYKIGLKGNSLQFSYGLINNKNTLIQPAKVQKVTKIQNFFQRKMKIERMNISQASSNIVKDKK